MTFSDFVTIIFTVGVIVLLNGYCENLCCCNLITNRCEDDVLSSEPTTTTTTFDDDGILYSPIRRHATLLDEDWITE